MGLRVHIKLNDSGIKELLRSSEVQADLKARAERIAAAAGQGMEVETSVGSSRARAVVVTATPQAMEAEARYRDLTRALDAGR